MPFGVGDSSAALPLSPVKASPHAGSGGPSLARGASSSSLIAPPSPRGRVASLAAVSALGVDNETAKENGGAKQIAISSSSAAVAAKLAAMKVPELRKLCDDHEVANSGSRAELVTRLHKAVGKVVGQKATPARRSRSDPPEPKSAVTSRLPKMTQSKSVLGQALKEIA